MNISEVLKLSEAQLKITKGLQNKFINPLNYVLMAFNL